MNKSFIFSIVLILLSCGSATKREKQSEMLTAFAKRNHIKLDSLKSIFILSEKGCPNCNRSFSMLIKKHCTNGRSINVVSAKGSVVDISPFLSNTNTYFDYLEPIEQRGLFGELSVIFLEGGKIDTTVKIEAVGIQDTFRYLEKRLAEE